MTQLSVFTLQVRSEVDRAKGLFDLVTVLTRAAAVTVPAGHARKIVYLLLPFTFFIDFCCFFLHTAVLWTTSLPKQLIFTSIKLFIYLYKVMILIYLFVYLSVRLNICMDAFFFFCWVRHSGVC